MAGDGGTSFWVFLTGSSVGTKGWVILWDGNCPMCCLIFGNIPDFFSLDARSILVQLVKTESVFRYCQIFLRKESPVMKDPAPCRCSSSCSVELCTVQFCLFAFFTNAHLYANYQEYKDEPYISVFMFIHVCVYLSSLSYHGF